MSKLARFNLNQWCFPVGGILIILLMMKLFDIPFLANYPTVLGILGLCLIGLGAVARIEQ